MVTIRYIMVAAANLVEVAALVGHTTRATILAALMSGQALTSSELAQLARISRSTASEHLTKLVNARLLSVTRKRRHSYYRIASPLVARMLEGIKAVAAIEVPARYQPRSVKDEQLRFARTCYDHLAGWLGVAIADALVAQRYLVLTDDGGALTPTGKRFFAKIGVTLTSPSDTRNLFCRACLDWSERRYHLAGQLGTAIWHRCIELGWLKRDRDSRVVRVTGDGLIGLRKMFGVNLDNRDRPSRTATLMAPLASR